jgi:hypothetical protein
MGSIVAKFIASEIDKALHRHRLPHDSPLRNELEVSAEIGGGRTAVVRVRDESNRVLPLDDRIEQLKDDPHFCAYFPPKLPRVSRNDASKLRENFSKIARGEVVVE